MGNKDISFKELLKEIAKDLSIYLFNLEITDEIELIDKEFSRIETREADLVVKHKNQIIHIEIQNDNDKTMHLRMMRYLNDIMFLYEDYEILQYVVYIGKNKCLMKDKIENKNIKFRYNLIDMKKIDCEKFLNADKAEMVILAVLCDFGNKDKQEIINKILIRLKELSENENIFRRNLEILTIFSSNRNLEDNVEKGVEMLRNIDIKKNPLYRIGLKEGIYLGEEEGIQKGILRGKIELLKEMGFSDEEIMKRLNIKDLKKFFIKN
jgi:predicted transposase/invertase (TIGR01784 family)